jgi:hypothetical protein
MLCEMHMWKQMEVQSVMSFPATGFHGLTMSCLSVPLICGRKGQGDASLRTESIFVTVCQ